MLLPFSSRSVALITILGAIVALAILVFPRAAAPGDARLALLTSEEAAPYKDVLKGFQQSLNYQGLNAILDQYPLQGNPGKAIQALQEAKQKGTTIFFTVGTLATQTAIKEAGDAPIVAALVPNAVELKAANATGVVLDFSAETQLQWLRRLIPDAKIVGVVFNPKKNATRVEAAT